MVPNVKEGLDYRGAGSSEGFCSAIEGSASRAMYPRIQVAHLMPRHGHDSGRFKLSDTRSEYRQKIGQMVSRGGEAMTFNINIEVEIAQKLHL